MEERRKVQKGFNDSLACTILPMAGPSYFVGCIRGGGSWNQEYQLAWSSNQVETN